MLFYRGNEYIGVIPAGVELKGRLADGLSMANCVVSFDDHKKAVCVGKMGLLKEGKSSFYSGEKFLVVWGDNDKQMAEYLSNRPRRCIVYVGSKPAGATSEAMLKLYDKDPSHTVYRFDNPSKAVRVVVLSDEDPVAQAYDGSKWVSLGGDKPKAKTAAPKPPAPKAAVSKQAIELKKAEKAKKVEKKEK